MHGALSESGELYGAGANRGDGMEEYTLDRPEDRASAMWKHMRAWDRERGAGSGSKSVPRSDWNYIGGLADEGLSGGGGGGARPGGAQRGAEGSGLGDLRKRSLAQISGMWGMADARPSKYINGAACVGAKLTNGVDSSLRPDMAYLLERPHRRARLDEPEMALSEASTTAP
jgi:hypothetical protein